MSNETIMLAKSYKPGMKVQYPVQVTEKLDGVAMKFYKEAGEVKAISRNGKFVPTSVDHIIEYLVPRLIEGDVIIGELYIPNKPFKDISGAVRREEPCPELQLFMYDFIGGSWPDPTVIEYADRINSGLDVVIDTPDSPVQLIHGLSAYNEEELLEILESFQRNNPDAEGVVIRSWYGEDSYFKEGKRSKGMLKYKPKPTVDLEVVSFEEATSKDGEPLGMIGRINVLYKGNVIGVGPGKSTHAERKTMYENSEDFIGKIAEIEYMRDPSYEALRQPTFQRWREDKSEPSEVA